MGLILHHLKKDIHCLQLLLWLWFLLLLLNSLLMRSGLDRLAVTGAGSESLAIAHSILFVLQELLQLAIVCQLVHADGLAGTSSFWLTRPISRKELFLSKSLFVLVILVLPALIVETIVMWLNAIPVSNWLSALAELVILQSALFLLPMMLLAALTPNLARLGVTVLATLIAFFLVHYTVTTIAMNFGGARRTEAEVTSARLLAAVLVIGSCALLIACQYFTRKTARAAAGAILAMFLVISTLNFWHRDFVTAAAALPARSLLNPDNVNLALHRDSGTARFESHERSRHTSMRKIMGYFDFLGVPPGFIVEPVGIQVTLELPGGNLVPSVSENPSGWASDLYFYFERYQRPIINLLESSKRITVLNDTGVIRDSRFPVLSVDLETFQNYKHTPGVYRADAELRAHQYQVAAAVPLRLGSGYVNDSGGPLS